jgi:hypothetical protein
MTPLFEFLISIRMPLVYVLCALIVIHYAISIALANKTGSFVWMYQFNKLAKNGEKLARYGYINGILIYAIGAVVIFPPIVIRLI